MQRESVLLWGDEGTRIMHAIVEVDEHGTLRLPADVLAAIGPLARFALEVQGATLVLRPVERMPLWQSATPEERAGAVRHWARQERPTAPPLPAEALRREHLYE
jgi:hypothetical protein